MWSLPVLAGVAVFLMLLMVSVFFAIKFEPHIGLDGGYAAFKRNDFATALKAFQIEAERGNPIAYFYLALMYADGQGVTKDETQAVIWYRKAADQGFAGAQNGLGNMYSSGRGVAKDDMQAVVWYLKAANQEDEVAQYNIGSMYYNGKGVPKDDAKAVAWYRKSADRGFAAAQHDLGLMYSIGRGVAKDETQAIAWIRKAADQGDAIAQASLGAKYAEGGAVTKDEQLAVSWLRKSAEQGDVAAQYNLGVMYEYGRGVSKDEPQAAIWYRKAAEKGAPLAQFALGFLFANGLGVPKDLEQAYFWWLLAGGKGEDRAKKSLGVLEQELTAAQRGSVQAAARNWKPAIASGNPNQEVQNSFSKMPVASQSRQPSSTGTSFAVTKNRHVTNVHVVESCSRVTLAGLGEATVVAMDRRNDLALIETKADSAPSTLRTGRLRQGDVVSVIGFPLSGVLASGSQVTTGNVSALAGLQNDSRFIQISAPVMTSPRNMQ